MKDLNCKIKKNNSKKNFRLGKRKVILQQEASHEFEVLEIMQKGEFEQVKS